MGALVQFVAMFVILGAFWGLSPSVFKLLGTLAVPISHVIVLCGAGVGLGLLFLAWLSDRRLGIDRRLVLYGLGCGTLLNIPFALQMLFARHVGAAEMAIVFSTSPFCSYFLAVMVGRDRVETHRILALIAGFVAAAVLILSRETTGDGFSWWTAATFVCPVLYAFYNLFTAAKWPEGVDVRRAGMAESFASSLVAFPFAVALALPGVTMDAAPPLTSYWPVALLTLMWVAERIVYFGLIKARGPVYTIQAIYVAAPAGVLYGIAFFGEKPDAWLWVSLALLMLALWLNNRPSGVPRQAPAEQA